MKPRKVRVEELVAQARGNEIVIIAQVAQVHLDERFLQRDRFARALGVAGAAEIAFANVAQTVVEDAAHVAGIRDNRRLTRAGVAGGIVGSARVGVEDVGFLASV